MSKLKLLELFGGIGACSKALEKLGIDYEIVDYVEIDKYAVASYNAIHNTNFEPQDITTWNKDIEVDLIMHGSPCQDFSLSGKQAGGDEGSGTRSSLMYETIRIVDKLKPKYVIWENVKNVISKKHKHNYDNYCNRMSELGYMNYGQVLNAKDYGIPQNRERVFTISIRKDLNQTFEFPQKQELKLRLKDMLEDNVDEKYYLSKKMIDYISATGTANFKNCDSKINLDIARPLTTDQNKRAGTTNYLSNDLPNNYDLNDINEPTQRSTRSGIKVIEPKLLIKNNTKLGYLEAQAGDGVYTNTSTKRGTVQKEMIQILNTSNNKGVVFKNTKNYIEWKEKGKYDIDCRAYKEESIAPTCTANSKSKVINNLSIRKLTPKECWRLMSFDDEDFEKAKQFNSDTQLYKQAGNSIVVNVLMVILNNLIMK